MCMVPDGPQDAAGFISRARTEQGDVYADTLTEWFRQRFERRVNSTSVAAALKPCECLLKDGVSGWVCNGRCEEAADVYAWRDPFAVERPRGAASGSFLATEQPAKGGA